MQQRNGRTVRPPTVAIQAYFQVEQIAPKRLLVREALTEARAIFMVQHRDVPT
jgi:hypothetical protein